MKKYLSIAVLFLLAHGALADTPIAARVGTHHGPVSLKLELATTPTTREYGLMNRKTLAPGDGMLFAFPRPTRLSFWMKNTLIPLDMLFIDTNGTVVTLHPNAEPLSLAPIDSEVPIIAVIELNGGRAKQEGIAVGDHIDYALPKDAHVE